MITINMIRVEDQEEIYREGNIFSPYTPFSPLRDHLPRDPLR